MKPLHYLLLAGAALPSSTLAASDADIELLRQEISQIKTYYEQRITDLEQKLEQYAREGQNKNSEQAAAVAVPSRASVSSDNSFNPQVSLILDGRYSTSDSTDFALAGFQPGGEAGLPEAGFSTGHNELVVSANIDDKFHGRLSAAIVHSEGETEFELEEAFIETLGLGHGFTLKGGRFLSDIGYLNNIHSHAHDFADKPLVYDAMLGGRLLDTGVQLNWVAPTDFYLNLGAEITAGSAFPGGENKDGKHGLAFFAKTGGDFNQSASWQLGASHYTSKFDVREGGGHQHGAGNVDNELLNGETEISAVDLVYKWAPNGNLKNRNFKFQTEYFWRNEHGFAEFTEGANSAEADYKGRQKGYYAQAIYQFMPGWRVGLRYDHLEADNDISNYAVTAGILPIDEFLEESGFGNADNPDRSSFMIDYSPSHFSRIRLQYSELDNGREDNLEMIMLQYIMSLGAHGAHTY